MKNEETIDLLGIDLSEPTKINTMMREGLARMYGDEGFRTYLENAVKISNINLIKSMDNGDAARGTYYANRMETILGIITKAKDNYVNFERLKEMAKK